MKIKITRKEGSLIIGRKKTLTFTISRDLEQLGEASEELFSINEIDNNEWSLLYSNDTMEENNEMIEFVFSIEDYNRTFTPSFRFRRWLGR